MTNTFITPTLIATRSLATLYNTTILAQLVMRDYDPDFSGKQGDTITVRTPATFVANDFDRATGIELQAITEGSFPVVLDKIADVSFPITSEELSLEIDALDERIMTPAMEAIVQKVDGEIAEELVDAANGAGGGGVVHMTSVAHDVFTGEDGARAKLGRNKLPTSERYAVLSPEGAGVALGDELFLRADQSGSTDALREGSIGRVLGFGTFESQVLGEGTGDKGSADGVAFHRSAVALTSRTLEIPRGATPATASVANYKGLGLRVVWDYDINKKQDVCSIDFLYGVTAIRPRAAIDLDFGIGS